MDDLVGRLLNLEQQANVMLERARADAAQAMNELELEKRRLLDEYSREAEEHLREVREAEARQDDLLESELSQRVERLRDEMEQQFNQNSQRWQEELFRRCTGGGAT